LNRQTGHGKKSELFEWILTPVAMRKKKQPVVNNALRVTLIIRTFVILGCFSGAADDVQAGGFTRVLRMAK